MALDELSERTQAPVAPSALKAGLVIGLVSIVFSVIMYFTGNATNSAAGWLSVPITGYLVYFFQKKFRDKLQNGYIKYGKAFGFGVVACVVSSILSGAYVYVLYTMDPSLKDQALEQTYNDMIERGMSEGQIEQSLEMAEMFMTPSAMLMMVLFMGLLFGVIVSLITSAIVKKDHPLD